MKYTISYIQEIIQLFTDVCYCDPNDYGKLIKLKKSYLDYSERVIMFHLFEKDLNKKDIIFLKNSKVEDFNNEIDTLRLLIKRFFTFKIREAIIVKPFPTFFYFETSFHLADLIHESKIGFLTTRFEFVPETGNIEQETVKKSKADFKELIKNEKKKLSDLKSLKPKNQKRILNRERDLVLKVFSSALEPYKSVIESDFFEIKDTFQWYNKEIKIYLFDSGNPERYRLLINIYPSSTLKYEICPYRLTAYTMDYNNEEIASKMLNSLSTTISKKYNHKSLSSLHIRNPLEEALETFWYISNIEEKIILSKQIFQLLGFDVSVVNNTSEIFELTPIKLKVETNKNTFGTYDSVKKEKRKEQQSFLILSEKNFFDENSIIELKSIFLKNDIKINNLWTIGRVNQIPNNFLIKHKIKVFRPTELSTLLLDNDRAKLIIPFIQSVINKKDNNELLKLTAKKEKGIQLLVELDTLSKKEMTWKAFQDFMESIFKYLFSESFKNYFAKPQAEEYEGIRRPDLVIHNLNPLIDFWKQRKVDQKAIRVIVDFKNYTDKIDGLTFDDISKYLNDKRGNFGIIISKLGINSNGIKRQKHLYFDHSKLILSIDEVDIKEMINFKLNNQNPEEVLERKLGELIF